MRDLGSKKNKVSSTHYASFDWFLSTALCWFGLLFLLSSFEKLSWSKSLVRRWFNIKSKAQDFHSDNVFGQGGSHASVHVTSLFCYLNQSPVLSGVFFLLALRTGISGSVNMLSSSFLGSKIHFYLFDLPIYLLWFSIGTDIWIENQYCCWNCGVMCVYTSLRSNNSLFFPSFWSVHFFQELMTNGVPSQWGKHAKLGKAKQV